MDLKHFSSTGRPAAVLLNDLTIISYALGNRDDGFPTLASSMNITWLGKLKYDIFPPGKTPVPTRG